MTKKNYTLSSLIIMAVIVLAACTSGGRSIPSEVPLVRTEEPVATIESRETEDSMETGEFIETEESMEMEAPAKGLACTVSLWHSLMENEMESLKEVAAAFQEMNPNVEFDFLYTPNSDIKSKFEAAAANGGGPSILIGSAEWGPAFYDALLVHDVSEFASDELLATINPAALGVVQYSDALVGLPLKLKGVLMFRNASLVPEAPTTFDELVEMAQAATSADVVGAYLEYGLFFSASHLHALGGALMDSDGNPTFNDEKGVEWVEMLKRFKEAGPVENNTDNDVNLFLEGRSGILIDGLWNAAHLAEAIGSENLVIDPWPSDMSGYVQTDNIYLNANLESYSLECSWAFMEYLLSPEGQMLFSDPDLAGNVPAIVGLKITEPIQQQAMTAFAGGIAFPVIPEMGAYWGPVNDALLAVVEEGADPAEALQTAHDAVVAAVAEIRVE